MQAADHCCSLSALCFLNTSQFTAAYSLKKTLTFPGLQNAVQCWDPKRDLPSWGHSQGLLEVAPMAVLASSESRLTFQNASLQVGLFLLRRIPGRIEWFL